MVIILLLTCRIINYLLLTSSRIGVIQFDYTFNILIQIYFNSVIMSGLLLLIIRMVIVFLLTLRIMHYLLFTSSRIGVIQFVYTFCILIQITL